MVEVQRQSHWRDGEEPIAAVERAVAAEKRWGSLRQLPPSSQFDDAYEAELNFSAPDVEEEREGPLALHAHRESKGVTIIRLTLGGVLLRRAHIGGVHQEPDEGPVYYGPHIHFPTTGFGVIAGRRARSRIYGWDVPETISLWDAVAAFATQINLVGDPVELQRRLTGG